MREVEIKDEPAGKTVNYVITQWSLKWVNMGSLWLASNFPDCRNTKPIVKEIGVTCPKCDKGQIIERRSNKKKRLFLWMRYVSRGDFVSWDKPIGRKCPKCEGMLVERS